MFHGISPVEQSIDETAAPSLTQSRIYHRHWRAGCTVRPGKHRLFRLALYSASRFHDFRHDVKKTQEDSMRKFLIAMSMLLASAVCAAQDASLLAGRLNVTGSNEHSFAAELGYSYRLGDYAALSADYLNEGHPHLHHRDGLTTQFWLHTKTPEQGLTLAVGAGPYYYFDTTSGAVTAADYRNLHGRGSVVSVSAKWHLEKRSYVELRANRVRTRGEGDSTMLLLGMGYELRNLPEDVKKRNAEAGDSAITLQGGQTIVNSFESERAMALALEYRHTYNENIEWSALLLNEGPIGLVSRKGVAGQLWLLMPFTERTVLEIGGGPYLMRDRVNHENLAEDSKLHLVPLVSVGMRYRLSPEWRTQFTWSRVVTDYHRDSDLLMLGLGRVF
jgi:hypothetical protein